MRATVFIVCLSWAALASAQQSEVASADAHYAAGRWAEAAAGYERVVRSTPENGTAWFRLGVAHINLQKWATAKDAFNRAIALKALPARAHFNLAIVHAHNGASDSAYAELDEAVKAGMVFGKFIKDDKNFAPMMNEPRMVELLARMDKLEFPCKGSSDNHALDFWIGSWDVYVSGQLAGTNDVQQLLGQCMLLENWTGSQAGAGKSMNFYDPGLKKWRQVWIADNGSVQDYKGEFRDGAMRFEGEIRANSAPTSIQRLTLTPLSPDSVRQLFEGSTDGGKTWTPNFDGLYIRRKK